MLTIFPFIPMLRRAGIGVMLIAVGFTVPMVLAQGSTLQMLDRLELGQWEVRARDKVGQRNVMCIDNGRDLIQIRHAGATCRSFVVEDGPGAVTVQYTCPGNGYGRTHIRYENARLAQVETQGIAGGLPFDFSAEARKVGDCAATHR